MQLENLVEETEKREKEVLLKRRTLELLPSARDNIGMSDVINGATILSIKLSLCLCVWRFICSCNYYNHYYYLICDLNPLPPRTVCLHSQVAGARRSGYSAYVGAGPGVGATPPAPSRSDDGQGGRAEHGMLLYYIAHNVYIIFIIIYSYYMESSISIYNPTYLNNIYAYKLTH